jgi:acetoin utilization deacetylase AcuC-like enzyme
MRYVYDPRHLLHNPEHEVQFGVPLGMYELPARAESIRRALAADDGFQAVEPAEHGTDPITAVHDPGLLRYLERAWSEWRGAIPHAPAIVPDTVLHPSLREGMEDEVPYPAAPTGRIGRWCWDTMTPIVQGTYLAARGAVDVSVTAANLVLDGERIAYGLARPPGHHAPRGSFGGYCYFNNAAIVAEHAVARTGGRVAILDVDYHHGNGTQQIFYRRGDVFYASLHGDPDRAFPYYLGYADERGQGDGAGTNLNIPLPAGTPDDEYIEHLGRALDAISDFGPELLVVSLGIDTYGQDPISDFALTTAGYHRIGGLVAGLDKPTVVLQEGGYFIPHLGENVRQWLRGFEGRPLDLEAVSGVTDRLGKG